MEIFFTTSTVRLRSLTSFLIGNLGCLLFLSHAGLLLHAVEAPRTSNRTLPEVTPPKTGLNFSANPTTQEISAAWVFDNLLVPVGGEPTAEENAALAGALGEFVRNRASDDFSGLVNFLDKFPGSPWNVSLLCRLGTEYYNTAHYSLALEAWQKAWALGRTATEAPGKLLADHAACELAGLYARLGRVTELTALLQSVEKRAFFGSANERMNVAREALWMMNHRPEVSFRCGPIALQSVKRAVNPDSPIDDAIVNSASTSKGFSLAEVKGLSEKIGLDYQMAFRQRDAAFVVPCVVHWNAGHYAAIVSKVGERYLGGIL